MSINPDNEVSQINHYAPFGLNLEGNWNGQNGANKKQYNGKEWNDDFGLGWNDYGARFYDPAMARWLAVDPMAEKYYMLGQYTYVANNPILFIDPNGMEFTAAGLTEVSRLTSQMDNNIKGIDDKITSQKNKLSAKGLSEKDAAKINNNIKKLESEKSDLNKQYDQVRGELATLAASDQQYDVQRSDKFSDSGTERGGATFNFSTGAYEIILPTSSNLAMLAHELKHAYQFEKGLYSVGPHLKTGANLLYDKTDEVEAYQRGGLFGGSIYSVHNLPSDYNEVQSKASDIYTALPYVVLKGTPNEVATYQKIAKVTGHAFRVDGKTYFQKK